MTWRQGVEDMRYCTVLCAEVCFSSAASSRHHRDGRAPPRNRRALGTAALSPVPAPAPPSRCRSDNQDLSVHGCAVSLLLIKWLCIRSCTHTPVTRAFAECQRTFKSAARTPANNADLLFLIT